MLLFKKKFLEAIRRGEKTQTIRLWARPRLKSGQRSYIPGVGYIHINSVEPVELVELTDDDAQPDGFPTADCLRAEIDAIYSQYPDRGQKAYRIRFQLAPGEKKLPRGRSKSNDLEATSRDRPTAPPQSCDPHAVGSAAKNIIPSQAVPSTSCAHSPRIRLPADGFSITHSRRKSANP